MSTRDMSTTERTPSETSISSSSETSTSMSLSGTPMTEPRLSMSAHVDERRPILDQDLTNLILRSQSFCTYLSLYTDEIRSYLPGLPPYVRRRQAIQSSRLVGVFRTIGKELWNRRHTYPDSRELAYYFQSSFIRWYRELEQIMILFTAYLDLETIPAYRYRDGEILEAGYHQSLLVTFTQKSIISPLLTGHVEEVLHKLRKLRNRCAHGLHDGPSSIILPS